MGLEAVEEVSVLFCAVVRIKYNLYSPTTPFKYNTFQILVHKIWQLIQNSQRMHTLYQKCNCLVSLESLCKSYCTWVWLMELEVGESMALTLVHSLTN